MIKFVEFNDVVFVVGLVGMGKIYMVVVLVVCVLKNKVVKKIILMCLVVEVGESFGFLFGDLKEKIDFYLWLFYDFLDDMILVEML